MAPPAAGRLSTTICWPNCSDTFAATRRITVSVGPAAARATTRRTGRVGYVGSAAYAVCGTATAKAITTAAALINSIGSPHVLLRLAPGGQVLVHYGYEYDHERDYAQQVRIADP